MTDNKKKKILKSNEKNQSIQELMDSINKRLTESENNKTSNLDIITKNYLENKKDLQEAKKLFTKIKNNHENFTTNLKSDEIINDESFDDMINQILNMSECDITLNQDNIESVIKQYQEMSKSIALCQKYLNSKKIDIIYCDDQK
jgi:hypothetical protein